MIMYEGDVGPSAGPIPIEFPDSQLVSLRQTVRSQKE